MGTFTYDPATDIGRVRRYLGDTRADAAYFDDEEIAASLATHGNVGGAVYECAMQLAADATKQAASVTEGTERRTRSHDNTRRPEFWLAIAAQWKSHAVDAVPRLGVLTSSTPSDGTPITAFQSALRSRR